MRLGLFVKVVGLEAALENGITFFNLIFVNDFQRFLIDVFLSLGLFCETFVSFQENLNCFDTYRDELLPRNLAVRVFICKCQQCVDVTAVEVVVVKFVEGVVKLFVLKIT